MNSMFRSLLVAALLLGTAVGCTRVTAGNVGVLVHQLGGEKGVDAEVVGVGRYWVGWNEELYVFPTFTQNVVYAGEEAVRFNDKDGLTLATNVNASYFIQKGNVASVFQKYRTGVEEISGVVLRREIENAFNAVASTYSADYIYGAGRTMVAQQVTAKVQEQVGKYGVTVEKINMVGEMALPDQVREAINAKIKATQLTIQRQNEVAQVKAEADKARERANGAADAMLTVAKAEAEALDIKGAAVARNSNIIEYTKATRWDGKLPQVTGGVIPMMDINK